MRLGKLSARPRKSETQIKIWPRRKISERMVPLL